MSAPVVVAVDGTEDGRRALRYGVDLARTYDAPLRLLHVRHDNVVVAPMMPLFPEPSLDEIAARVLQDSLAEVERLGWEGPDPETVLARAPRVAAVVDHCADARCVVLGRRSSAQRLLTGSTTAGVAAHSAVPVVCVPDTWDPELRFGQVAAGIDCSPKATQVLETAAALAHALGAHLLIMHAWRPVGQYDAAISARTFEGRWEQEVRPIIDALVDPVLAAHPDVKADVDLRFDRPIVSLHEANRVSDLLVIGRHSDDTRYTPALGSTARTVIRTCERPVVVVPTAIGADR